MQENLCLRYDQPAKVWEENVLPIGNSDLGASIMGGIRQEQIILNEKSLWIGGPSPSRPGYKGGNVSGSVTYLRQVQKALQEKDHKTVDGLLEKLTGETDGYGAYQTLGNLFLTFDGVCEEKTSSYQRYLDLNEAVSGVVFSQEGVQYTREYLASYPDHVVAMRLCADQKGTLSFTAFLDGYPESGTVTVDADSLSCTGALQDNGLRYQERFLFELADGEGEITAEGQRLQVRHATQVIVYFAAATDYANVYPAYRSGIDPADLVRERLEAAKAKGYTAIRQSHIRDYQELFQRVTLHLEEKPVGVFTDQLLREYRRKTKEHLPYDAADHYLEVLYYQYGRYLLIASSRDGSLPANLQGVWNESNTPPWCCDYHINVNLQMNYWPAMVANLRETATSLVDYVDSLREPGRVTAADYYGIVSDEAHPENGWAAHTQSTPFGWTCPGYVFTWGWCSAAAAWLDLNLWEYYLYTEDTEYLKAKIYPILRESARFYLQELCYDEEQERYVSSPTYSPEHGPVTIGNTYEQSLIQALLQVFVKAAGILGYDAQLSGEAARAAEKMKPYQISQKTGMLQEWYEEDEEDFDTSEVEKHHRHTSHLLGLYPADTINYNTKELMEAAKKSLNDRGDDGTGWGMVMKMCLWSRLGEGDRAYVLFNNLLADRTHPNLWDVHPPFQIDGNLGAVAAVSELLLQSHMGYIQLLPALPAAWQNGSFTGLCARGGFELDLTWEQAKVTGLVLRTMHDKVCRIRTEAPQQILAVDQSSKINGQDGSEEAMAKADNISWNEKNGIVEFAVKKEKEYHILF